jgi:hypothetical protein
VSVTDPAGASDRTTTIAAARSASQSLADRIATNARTSREALLQTARSVSREMNRRSTAAGNAPGAAEKAREIFGRDFTMLVRFQPNEPSELAAAMSYGPTLAPDEEAKRQWLAQAERVRTPLERWRRLELYTTSLGTAPPLFSVVQFPHAEPARWAALPFASEEDRPPAGRVSLAIVRAASPAATDPWTGFSVDEWTEIIPSREETTGISFHYDDPGAEAAQTLLLAVPPTSAEMWNLSTLLAILGETLDLAKMRAVHGEFLGALGQLLPAAFLAANADDETITTDFTRARAYPAQLVFES